MKTTRSLLVLFVALAACSKAGAGDNGAPPAAESASTAESAVDATLAGHVKAHVDKCTVNVEQGQAFSCKDGVVDALSKHVRESKPAAFASTMIALVRKKDDAKTSAVAVALLAEQFDNLGDEGKRKNATKEAVTSALAALKDESGNRATRMAGPIAQLATIAAMFDPLYAVADAHPTKEARDNVYRHLLVFGRTKGLPKLKEVAEKTPAHASAALDAVPRMSNATDEERSAACPWAEGYLKSADLGVAAKAAEAMVFCKGKHIDALLAEAETRLAKKEYKNPFAMVLREPCAQLVAGVTKRAADDAQCEGVYTFLEKVVNDAGADDATRSAALFNIYYQRRDEKTLKLMRKYENHPNKEIQKRAKEAIASLTTTYKLKG
ncbi:MAG: hypothetical protein KIT84_13645 [Labilithrix sp.]|nr:hypothetical protein [Labilithrix sp.]MCW5812062.1 hypothetical protein [Labilithrix sp.]